MVAFTDPPPIKTPPSSIAVIDAMLDQGQWCHFCQDEVSAYVVAAMLNSRAAIRFLALKALPRYLFGVWVVRVVTDE